MAGEYICALLSDESQIRDMRRLVQDDDCEIGVAEFDEWMALEDIRQATCVWYTRSHALAAFAFVDSYDNLVFAILPGLEAISLFGELLEWGRAQAQQRQTSKHEPAILDVVCSLQNRRRLALLREYNFHEQGSRSMLYSKSLKGPIERPALATDFRLRPVQGEREAPGLVNLHRACFGTENMTIDYRLAMMRAPGYRRDLDLVIETERAELIAFCACGLAAPDDDGGQLVGTIDTVGVRPAFRRRGLGVALIETGLYELRRRGAKIARLGTRSDNLAMRRLAESTGFRVVSEKIWLRVEF